MPPTGKTHQAVLHSPMVRPSPTYTAVTASINDGDGSQELTERPTDGAVIYELTGAELNDGFSAITASWVAEDEPFVHTSSTPAGYPR